MSGYKTARALAVEEKGLLELPPTPFGRLRKIDVRDTDLFFEFDCL